MEVYNKCLKLISLLAAIKLVITFDVIQDSYDCKALELAENNFLEFFFFKFIYRCV